MNNKINNKYTQLNNELFYILLWEYNNKINGYIE